MTERMALVLGATGGIGGAVARTLLARGWSVRAMHRNPAGRGGNGARLGEGRRDGGRRRRRAAAEGAALVVHAVNPPGYRDWEKLVLPMLDNTIAAARAAGAAILLPGTVYNYGPDALPLLSEASPQNPVTRKGAIRVAMERRLAEAAGGHAGARRPRRRLLRAAGRQQLVLARPGQARQAARGAITAARRAGVGHQWAYLPDVAETMVRLVEAGEPPGFATFHMEGHWDADGTAMIAAIRRAVGERPAGAPPSRGGLMRLAAPVVPLFRELVEMRYLWEQPVRMTNDRLVAAIGPEPRTPLDVAVRDTLAGAGCLPPQAADAEGRRALA